MKSQLGKRYLEKALPQRVIQDKTTLGYYRVSLDWRGQDKRSGYKGDKTCSHCA
jgi:hypothetical protein